MAWLFLALGSAFANSIQAALNKHIVSLGRFSKFSVTFWSSLVASALLLIAAIIHGIPSVDRQFWVAIVITAAINSFTYPMMLRAYQLSEFSSVYSITLMTPMFAIITSAIILGELTGGLGILGVLMTVVGLWFVSSDTRKPIVQPETISQGSINRGILLALGVAMLWSISTNYDKIAAQHSSPFFAPAVSSAAVALLCGIYLAIRKKANFSYEAKAFGSAAFISILSLGAVIAISSVFFNFALLAGPATYVLSIKRLGILFGVLWAWLFFKEKNLGKKFLGIVIALAGIIAIVLS